MKHKFIIKNPAIKDRTIEAIRSLPYDHPHEVIIREIKSIRTLEQNAKMWAMLTDISRQVDWYGEKHTPEEWKDIITAGVKKQKAVPGIDGGFVVLGARTSKMSIREMIDVIDCSYAFGNDKKVRWTEPIDESHMGER